MTQNRVIIGDLFSANLDSKRKKYFQFVASDSTQLNSDVIRAFETEYPIKQDIDLQRVISGGVSFYAHTDVRVGLKLGLWIKAGHSSDVGNTQVLFRSTNDYGRGPGEAPKRASSDWWVWKVNEGHRHVGRLTHEFRDSYVGIVINPEGILELLRGNKYPPFYPEFE